MLNQEQILLLLDRLNWVLLYKKDEHGTLVVARKRGSGYSDDPVIARIQEILYVMLEAAGKRGR